MATQGVLAAGKNVSSIVATSSDQQRSFPVLITVAPVVLLNPFSYRDLGKSEKTLDNA